MKRLCVCLSLAAVALGGLSVSVRACLKLGPIELPVALGPTVLMDSRLFAVTTTGRLIAVNLFGKEVKDLAAVAAKGTACLDAAGNKVCVAGAGRIDLFDAETGKLLRSVVCPGDVCGAGIISGERVFVRNASAVSVLDLESGKTVHTIALEGKEKNHERAGPTGHFLAGKQLLVAEDGGTLAVLDLEHGKVVRRFKTPCAWVGGVRKLGDKVFVLGLRYGYGVWTDSLGCIDCETGKYTSLKLNTKPLRQTMLTGGPKDTLLLAGPDGVFQYDSTGALIAPLMGANTSRLLGCWSGRLLLADAIADKTMLRPQDLPQSSVKATP